MKTSVMCLAAFLVLTNSVMADTAKRDTLQLQDVIKFDSKTLPVGESAEYAVPALPAVPGKIIILQFKAVTNTPTRGGCNFNGSVELNDSKIGRRTASGDERMIGRPSTFKFSYDYENIPFPVFGGPKLMLMFAPDIATGNSMTIDGLGATFVFNISDIARGVDGNTLKINNIHNLHEMIVEDIEIGWVDKDILPKPKSIVPKRGNISDSITAEKVTVLQADADGFAIKTTEGIDLLVETAIGMKNDIPSVLTAEDKGSKTSEVNISTEKKSSGYHVTAVWPKVTMKRIINIRDGIVYWSEKWTNTSDEKTGVPFRHRVFLKGQVAKFLVAGDTDASAFQASAGNPTLFVESDKNKGNGFGITAESDWLRLLMWMRTSGGVGEIYSETLALDAGKSIDFALTITPVNDGGGYWTFINSLRQRWGLNDYGIERPYFFGYSKAPDCKNLDEEVKKSLGHLGPIYMAVGPWLKCHQDAYAVRGGICPKLPEDAPRTPGGTPDLDVEKFLTFEHREPSWQKCFREVDAIKRVCPQVKPVAMTHPAMEVVYKPCRDKWPWDSEAIMTADGKPFESAGYTNTWMLSYAKKGWGVLYYVPRPGSAHLESLLEGMRRSMDEIGTDGVYCDEFSWAGTQRGYSRYDYSRWDGYSADLDENGNIVKLKTDNAYVTGECQVQMVQEAMRRGKFFLGNGPSALMRINALPLHRFIEGGNGYGTYAGGHLSHVPLVFGNTGDEHSRKGVFETVKLCLTAGCIYSPVGHINLLLEGSDNFVCKLYPITIQKIGAGFVTGKERMVTVHSDSYDWPGYSATLKLYEYNADGNLISKNKLVKVSTDKKLELKVPSKGLVIAEIVKQK